MADLKVEVRGRDYDVTVGSDGIFYTLDATGNRAHADSIKALKDKLSKVSIRVSVPYTRLDRGWTAERISLVDGEFTGRHSDGRRFLAREGGRPVQYGLHEMSSFLERLDDVQRAELTRLHEAEVKAKENLAEFISIWRMVDPANSIERAIDAAGAAADDDGHRDR